MQWCVCGVGDRGTGAGVLACSGACVCGRGEVGYGRFVECAGSLSPLRSEQSFLAASTSNEVLYLRGSCAMKVVMVAGGSERG